MIDTFSSLKMNVAGWLDRDDIDDAIDTMIGLMEARLYSELRVDGMETALAETIVGGTITLPADFLEFKHLYLDTAPTQAIEFKNLHWIQKNYPVRSSVNKPLFAAISNGSVVFGPYPDDGYDVAGVYYARPTALSITNESNFLTVSWPDLLLYGTLVHSAMYLGQDARMSVWEAAYGDAFRRIKAQDNMEDFPAGVALQAVRG